MLGRLGYCCRFAKGGVGGCAAGGVAAEDMAADCRAVKSGVQVGACQGLDEAVCTAGRSEGFNAGVCCSGIALGRAVGTASAAGAESGG